MTFPDVEVGEAGAVQEGHGQSSVIQSRALGHVQEAQHRGGGGRGAGPGHRDGGDHWTS